MNIGILDQIPLPRGSSVDETFTHTIQLAKEAERLGYRRYWLAEHHNTNGLLSTSPEIMIPRLASATTSIKVGSGGVLLPQYSPFKVAEDFKLLEALFPGRIELGVGRSPGGSERTRRALTNDAENNLEAFPQQVTDLYGFLRDELPRQHSFRTVKTSPRFAEAPPLSILALSKPSAQVAAANGLGLVFGHFISPDRWQETLTAYRDQFIPSSQQEEPSVTVCVFVVCAESSERAEELATTLDHWLLGVEKGNTKIPSLEDVHRTEIKPEDQEKIEQNRRRMVVGTAEEVKAELLKLSERYATDDFLVITNIAGFEARIRSYQLLAEAFGLNDD
ncbi:LLM class flavin-dependent oxidoreductase [Salsuginibacillus kocurii]|uniref:LLM class flavin-dependent oxidoreductase n=1 Tax=Salsuginibacillus kocurii TaxID=427078 RepID=UPI000364FBFA|nr:LLM class flavin-dependent oxidoreductase [Salsuginibacillus kocurii]